MSGSAAIASRAVSSFSGVMLHLRLLLEGELRDLVEARVLPLHAEEPDDRSHEDRQEEEKGEEGEIEVLTGPVELLVHHCTSATCSFSAGAAGCLPSRWR